MNIQQKLGNAAESVQQTTRGGGCGCLGIGCGVVGALMLLICVSSYFVTLHSSLPLAMIEKALESEGAVEVEGLRGSISKGFEIDSLKFQSDEFDEWNELRNVTFSYNGFVNLLRTKRLIITEASIGGATIYAQIDGQGEVQIDPKHIDGEGIAEEISDEWNDFAEEFQENDAQELKELRIDLVSARNIEIVDPETGVKIEFEKAEFTNYQMLDGKIRRLGELEVVSNQMEMHTERSEKFSNEPIAWKLVGEVKPALHKTIVNEIPFNLDFAILSGRKFKLFVELCDGKVRVDEPYGQRRAVELIDFSPAEYFDSHSKLAPSRWNVKFSIDRTELESAPAVPDETEASPDSGESKTGTPVESATDQSAQPESEESETTVADAAVQTPDQDLEVKEATRQPPAPRNKFRIEIEQGGTFMLGETEFAIESQSVEFLPHEKDKPQFVVAKGMKNDVEFIAEMNLKEKAPWFSIQLSSAGKRSNDVWSELFFDKQFNDLDSTQKIQVESAIDQDNPWRDMDFFEPVDF